MRDLADSDPVPFVLAHLRADERVTAELAATPNLTGHVTGLGEAPWPALVVSAGSDQFGDGRGTILASVTLTAYDSHDEAVGTYQLRRILLTAVQSLLSMPDHYPHTMPGGSPGTGPVINRVVPNGGINSMNTTAGQVRLSLDLIVYLQAGKAPVPDGA